MNNAMNQSRSRTSALGQFARWSVASVAILVIALACWRIYTSIGQKQAPSETIAPAVAQPPAAQPDDGQANWSRSSFTIKAGDGVRQTSASAWSVKGGRAFMQVRDQGGGSLELRFVYPFGDWLPEETIALLHTRWFLGPSEPLVAELSISPEQLGRLKSIPAATDIPVELADHQQLNGLFDDYLSATDKPAAEKALVEALVGLDARYYDRTMQLVQNIASQVKQVFTDDQSAALSKRFGHSPSGNATLPRTGRPTRER